jgi:RNA polymerase sigma-70 factor (ECF subfamily)
LSLKTAIRQKRHAHLLRNALRGDERSFQFLYRELFVHVDQYISRRVRNEQDAEDLVSTVFHHFLVNLESYDSNRGSVLTWIMAMARNTVIDHLRSQRNDIPFGERSLMSINPHSDVLSRLIEAEQLDRIMAELNSFPQEIDDLFNLRIGMGMSWREVSAVMGLSESAARMRFSRTIQEIRDRIRKKQPSTKRGADYA